MSKAYEQEPSFPKLPSDQFEVKPLGPKARVGERTFWEINCLWKNCGSRWTLPRGDGEQRPGNILHLLNHFAGHREKRNRDDDL